MLQDLENNFSELERKILTQKNYKNLTEKLSELNIEHEELKKKYDEEKKKSGISRRTKKYKTLFSNIRKS
jgi:membrane protein insertase Oxa1/YidC/SpoIIIJ